MFKTKNRSETLSDYPISFKFQPERKKFDLSSFKSHKDVQFSNEQIKCLENYLDSVQSNRWVNLYHSGHCCVAILLMITGILFFFTIILPILGLILGIYILVEKEKYYLFVFRKVLTSLPIIEQGYIVQLENKGIRSRLIYNKGKYRFLTNFFCDIFEE